MSKKRYFLPFELDAFANCGPIGHQCGLRIEQVSHGMLSLWLHVWRTKNDVVTTGHLSAFFFGANPCEALLTFGHLEATESGWRVKGAKEWLRVMSAQSEAGKAKSGNLQRGRQDLSGSPPASALKSAEAGDKPSGSPPALPETRDHPPPTSIKSIAGQKPPAPKPTRETDLLCEDFAAAKGCPYAWQGEKDGTAFARLRKHASLEEIRTRWRRGLKHPDNFHRISTVAQLGSKWNDLATPPPLSKGSVIHGQTAWGPDDDFLTGLGGSQ